MDFNQAGGHGEGRSSLVAALKGAASPALPPESEVLASGTSWAGKNMEEGNYETTVVDRPVPRRHPDGRVSHSVFGDLVANWRSLIPLSFVKATRCKDLHLHLVCEFLFLFLSGSSGPFHPGCNGFSHSQALVCRWCCRGRLTFSQTASCVKPSFGPHAAVSATRKIPPVCRHAGLAHFCSDLAIVMELN